VIAADFGSPPAADNFLSGRATSQPLLDMRALIFLIAAACGSPTTGKPAAAPTQPLLAADADLASLRDDPRWPTAQRAAK
jgi:hypothetical protein